MVGIVLAGGSGTRLYPLTSIVCKQLLPVYDKPLVYYPISLLMLAGIRKILIISTPKDLPLFRDHLGTGEQYGVEFHYSEQAKPTGLPEAFILGEDFIGNDNVTLVLGDNIFYGSTRFLKNAVQAQDLARKNGSGRHAQIFAYHVEDPRAYGVVEFDPVNGRILSLEEKPENPKSNYAVPGIYVFDSSVSARAKSLKSSKRGETEITDLIKSYQGDGQVHVNMIGRGVSWFDTGTPKAMLEAANFVASIENRQGLKIGCLIEVAARKGFISMKDFEAHIESLPNSSFRGYLKGVRDELLSAPQSLSLGT